MPKKQTTPIKHKTKNAKRAAAKPVPIRSKTAPSADLTGRKAILHQMLMKKKQEIERDLAMHLEQQLHEDTKDRTNGVLDIGDQAAQDISEELGLSFMEMRNKTLKTIHEALDRLVDGTYGLCGECRAEIPEKRLLAMPFATLCFNCQTQQETLEKIEKEEERFK